MNAMYNYQLLAQAILFCNAIFWTLAYINRVLTFLTRAVRNLDAKITIRQMLYMSISWAVFFWLMKAQF